VNETASRRPRLAIVASHPIQHFCPQYASFARRPEFQTRVFFASAAGLRTYSDRNFGSEVKWEGLDVDAFDHELLSEDPLPIDGRLDAPNVIDRLTAFEPDAVLIYGYDLRVSRRVWTWARRARVRLFMFTDSELRHRRSLLTLAAKRLIIPRYYRSVDVCLTTGDANEDYCRHYGAPSERLVRAPYPMDRDLYTKALADRDALRASARAALGVPPDAFVCGMVGKLVAWKRQSDAILALAQPGMERVHLVLLGTGSRREEWGQLAQQVAPGRVHFAGFIQPRDLPSYYFAIDCYVHTSEREPHSVAISEAVFGGCPAVISHRCGSHGPTDDVQVGRNGFVYHCGDLGALARAILAVGSDSHRHAALGRESRRIGQHNQELAHGDGIVNALRLVGIL